MLTATVPPERRQRQTAGSTSRMTPYPSACHPLRPAVTRPPETQWVDSLLAPPPAAQRRNCAHDAPSSPATPPSPTKRQVSATRSTGVHATRHPRFLHPSQSPAEKCGDRVEWRPSPAEVASEATPERRHSAGTQ